MDLFEYQGKQYFARFGIPVSPGGPADTVDEAVAAADAAGYPVVVKAQVQVGGRGKAGGIKLANDADEVRLHAGNILGMDIKGHVVKRVWVERASDIAEEYYASFTLDRSAKQHLLMLSAQGGVEIEEVAARDPDAIVRLHIDPVDGLSVDAARGRGRGGRHQPGRRRRRGRDPRAPVPLLHRGRLRPGRDQPADPQAHAARSMRWTRRSAWTATPSSGTRSGPSSRPPRSWTTASGWPGTRASSTSASRARWASSPTAPGWP